MEYKATVRKGETMRYLTVRNAIGLLVVVLLVSTVCGQVTLDHEGQVVCVGDVLRLTGSQKLFARIDSVESTIWDVYFYMTIAGGQNWERGHFYLADQKEIEIRWVLVKRR